MPTQPTAQQIQERLDALYQRHRSRYDDEVVSYYVPGVGYRKPEVPSPEQDRFAISLASMDGDVYSAGDHDSLFALQSISKVFVYGLALEMHGREKVLEQVGVEPSGESYNSVSVVFDEHNRRPHNPMVNAGAIATTDLVGQGNTPEAAPERILNCVRRYAGHGDLQVDEELFRAMMDTTDRNRAISYLMRSLDMIGSNVEENLVHYLRHNAITVTTRDLAMMAATLANGGVNPATGQRALEAGYVTDVLSVMSTCGMYDFAGQWTYWIGIPAKSGVGGGILALVPGKMGIAVLSPGLDEYGNSVRGIKVCEDLSDRLGLHVFASEREDALIGTADVREPTRQMEAESPVG